jgi:hypothetical protein
MIRCTRALLEEARGEGGERAAGAAPCCRLAGPALVCAMPVPRRPADGLVPAIDDGRQLLHHVRAGEDGGALFSTLPARLIAPSWRQLVLIFSPVRSSGRARVASVVSRRFRPRSYSFRSSSSCAERRSLRSVRAGSSSRASGRAADHVRRPHQLAAHLVITRARLPKRASSSFCRVASRVSVARRP